MKHVAYQLYGSRNFPPLERTLTMLAKTGFTAVEGYGAILETPEALKTMLDKSGLSMPSAHMGLAEIEADPARALATAHILGLEAVFVPYLMPQDRPLDAAGWTAFGKRLAQIGAPFQQAGLKFGWHNHDFELQPTDSGALPLDLIVAADPRLLLELDLGWVRVAGLDPVAWITKYAGRIAAVHVKDIAPDGACVQEDGWADVGHGIMDWTAIHAALQATGVDHYIVEHDNPSDDARFARRSLASVNSFQGPAI